jgi:hypothetical protein
MPVERHRAEKSCMKFHFGLHRTSRENFGCELPAQCDSTNLRKEIMLGADGMYQILMPEWAAGLHDGARPSGCCFRLVIYVAWGAAVIPRWNFGSSRAKWGARYLEQTAKIWVGEYCW